MNSLTPVSEAYLEQLGQENKVAVGITEEENGTWSVFVSGPSGIRWLYTKSGSLQEAQRMCKSANEYARQLLGAK